jgi:transposase-like protein
MAQLRKELRETREERDILKRAVAFMSNPRLCRKTGQRRGRDLVTEGAEPEAWSA